MPAADRIPKPWHLKNIWTKNQLSKALKEVMGGFVLAAVGRSYLARVESLLNELAEATADPERRYGQGVDRMRRPLLVACWLIPRLGRLIERHDLDVRVVASLLNCRTERKPGRMKRAIGFLSIHIDRSAKRHGRIWQILAINCGCGAR